MPISSLDKFYGSHINKIVVSTKYYETYFSTNMTVLLSFKICFKYH